MLISHKLYAKPTEFEPYSKRPAGFFLYTKLFD